MGLKALIAEDDPNIRTMLAMSLGFEGYDVISVGDGTSAIEAIDREPVDLVLLDVMMPGKSGYEVVEHIRRDSSQHTPVILVTAKTGDEDLWEGWRAGIDSYITKPYDVELLLSEMERLTSIDVTAGSVGS